MVETKQ